MVLGLRTKYRKGPTVHVDYLIHVQEIKPWPPSQSLKSLRSVLLQWENGDRNSGSTSSVVPSLGSGVGDGKIEFDQSFRLPVTLTREFSLRSGDAETFQKNYLEFNLYEPRRDKAVKGQHLGVAMIDLAEYGILKETVIISAPMNCKRSFRNTVQPVLFLKIQPFDKHSSSSTPKGSLVKESSLDLDGRDSVSALMNGEYADEAEIAAFTDDDISSHSSLTIYSSGFEITGDSPAKDQENALEAVKNSTQMVIDQSELPLESVPEKLEVNRKPEMQKHLSGSSSGSSSTDSASGVESPENDQDLLHSIPQSSLSSITGRMDSDNIQSSSSFIAYEATDKEVKCDKSISTSERKDLTQKACSEKITNGNRIIEENVEESVNRKGSDSYNTEAKVESSDEDPGLSDEPFSTNNLDSHLEAEDHKKIREQSSNGMESGSNGGIFAEDKGAEEQQEDGCKGKYEEEYYHSMEFEHVNKLSPDSRGKLLVDEGDTTLSRSGMWMKSSSLSTDRQRHGKSVRSSSDSPKLNGSASSNQHMGERKEIDILEGAHSGGRRFGHSRQNNLTAHSRESRANLSDGKFQQLEHRIEKLEGELREAAALELALYSIVAEHGSSANKVHAPARRLSRLHLHAWRHWSHARRASVAKSAISGLVLVVKACGNDVPRLSFWLSNSVILRVIISLALVDSKLSVFAAHHAEANGNVKENGKRSLLKWKESPSSKKENKFGFDDNSWEDPHTFTTALEKIEAWIFSRIIESVWWQTLIPHMQSASRKANEQKMRSSLRNSYGKKPILSDQEQANFSLELWKKAFKDACERICPVRAAGHECGCLPVLARMVMEQCVGRLDVAMFNAILRESADEIPTDPVSDPISDSKVLPIPAGKSSFGAGAQLKNAIGNWSRWLTDLFGIDDDECHEDENELDDNDRRGSGTSSKSFHLLNALSDLMMLPKDMLLNRAVKKEVCPSIGAPLIKRILSNFAPDEFCPDPIPEVVFEALDAEDTLDADEMSSIRNFPCDAAPVVYSPPSAVSLESIIGEVGNETPLTGSGSSLLRKSYTSDDELEELESPLTSILDGRQITTMPKQKTKVDGQRALRYQLLQEVWRD